MGQERWFLIGVGGLAVGACLVFRALHPADVALSEAGYLMRFGAADRVAAGVDALAERISGRPESSLGLGWQLAEAGYRASAERIFQAVWRTNPLDVAAGEALLALDLGGGEKAGAGRVLAEMHARSLVLSDAGLRMEAGLLVENGDFAGAVPVLNELARRRPGDSAVPVELGDVLAGQQRFAEATTAYRVALGLRPADPAIHLRLARALTWDAMRDGRRIVKRGDLALDD